ncbi:hypothetical protein J3A83DRAFT_1864565 [Scleroderma citrinum]
MASPRNALPSSYNSNLCEVCGIKAKYVDTSGVIHSYCGRTCAARGAAAGAAMKSPPCKIRGCSNVEDPTLPGFCSEDHAKRGVNIGLVQACARCKSLPQSSGQMCARCVQLPVDEPKIYDINSSGTVWREFQREWNDRWKDGGSATIEKLFEISYSPVIVAEKESYASSSGGMRLFRTFHASQCICDMGTNGTVLCTWASCGVCNIVKSAFKGVSFGAPHNKGRHGNGLYSCTSSSRADRYATSCLSSPYRVMIACDVVLPQVPSKNSSVLMDDLVVVRDSAAISPRYIVMYTRDK